MKKIILLATAVACFALPGAKAQTVNGVRLSEIHADFIEIKGSGRPFSDKTLISIEYGQVVQDYNSVVVKDDSGKRMEFNSTIDFLNKFKNYGYELFRVYSEQAGKDSSRPVYLMKRK
ncbi:hypothetical protein QWY86_12265 [Pedobacter aquatilis]|uniref:hypothetical protein n=1 Tax=Pedobacter aquatilis TaxID=351343 RepID=UPI0025B41457|nr:hypothetical protein [Pedobacter aquatilis]MDN3587450.1 hypothetical protein [Pedobacter aquatilis]